MGGYLVQEPLVSVCCTTYNHEKYIADAIESFLMQKTTFKFEILIHDDASTDRTAEIIREYEKEYPDLIKPIYQIENQYSKRIAVDHNNYNRVRGKYVAICEGDDYWMDPYKLQKQVGYMEDHPECSLSVHAGYVVNAFDKKIQQYNRPSKMDKIFTVEEVIEGGGGLFLTNSMLFRKPISWSFPKFYEMSPVSDYPLVIYLALSGTVYYLAEYMSAYRVGDSESWTSKALANAEVYTQLFDRFIKMLDELNHYTNSQYEASIEKRKQIDEMLYLAKLGKLNEVKSGKYQQLYKEMHVKRKIILLLDQYSPSLSKFLRKNRRWLGG